MKKIKVIKHTHVYQEDQYNCHYEVIYGNDTYCGPFLHNITLPLKLSIFFSILDKRGGYAVESTLAGGYAPAWS